MSSRERTDTMTLAWADVLTRISAHRSGTTWFLRKGDGRALPGALSDRAARRVTAIAMNERAAAACDRAIAILRGARCELAVDLRGLVRQSMGVIDEYFLGADRFEGRGAQRVIDRLSWELAVAKCVGAVDVEER